MLHETSFHIINMYSISGQNRAYSDTTNSRDGVNQCGFERTLKIYLSTYNLSPSPPAIALTYLTSLPSTQLFLSKLKDRLKELFH